MFIEAIFIGMIIGLLRRGKIFRLGYVNFNMKPLIFISALLYLIIVVMNLGLMDYNSNLYTIFLTLSYILVIIFLITNIAIKFMFIPLIGLALNLAVLFANRFKFPLSADHVAKIYGAEMAELLINGKIKFFIPDIGSKLSFLGNIINIGDLLIVSIGDIIISIGIILVVQDIIADKFIQHKSKITFSKDIFR